MDAIVEIEPWAIITGDSIWLFIVTVKVHVQRQEFAFYLLEKNEPVEHRMAVCRSR